MTGSFRRVIPSAIRWRRLILALFLLIGVGSSTALGSPPLALDLRLQPLPGMPPGTVAKSVPWTTVLGADHGQFWSELEMADRADVAARVITDEATIIVAEIIITSDIAEVTEGFGRGFQRGLGPAAIDSAGVSIWKDVTVNQAATSVDAVAVRRGTNLVYFVIGPVGALSEVQLRALGEAQHARMPAGNGTERDAEAMGEVAGRFLGGLIGIIGLVWLAIFVHRRRQGLREGSP